MCNTTLMDQAVDWVIESTWNMIFGQADLYEGNYAVEFLLADVIHLENMHNGVIGYNPDLNFDFQIGL